MYIVSYDITNNKLRKKVSDVLMNYGQRVQYSVFECEIDSNRYKKMYSQLLELTGNMKEGNIKFYFLDKSCKERTVMIGAPKIYPVERGFSKEEEALFI